MVNLKNMLMTRFLNLMDVDGINQPLDDVDTAKLLQTILIVVSVVLGVLCVILIVTFFLRVRNLKRELRALSTVDFGSTASNLNRREAPTTNVFSVEGSNPVLNDNEIPKGVFDNLSIHSDDSDYAGLASDPTFKPNERRVRIRLRCRHA